MDLHNKLLELYKMVDFVIDENNYEDIDTITLYQGQIPYKLKEIEQDLLTLSE